MLPHAVKINPQIHTQIPLISEEKISIEFSSHKSNVLIGKRWSVWGSGSIRSKNNVGLAIAENMWVKLESAGFRPGKGFKIIIDPAFLSYDIETGFFTVTSNIKFVLSVTIKSVNNITIYARQYHGANSNVHLGTPFSWTNEKNINRAIASAIENVFWDNGFWRALEPQ